MIKRTIVIGMTLIGLNTAYAGDVSQKMLNDAQKESSEYLSKAMEQFKASVPTSINMEAVPKPEVGYSGNLVKKNMEQKLVQDNLDRQPTLRTKVFVSFGMKEDTLKKIVKSVDRLEPHNSVIVVQGLKKDSTMRETTAYIGKLTEGHNVAVQIDPTAFERFGINKVPAFVVYYDDPMYQASCSLTGQKEAVDTNNWDGVYGDVSIGYAINRLIETTDEEFVPYLEGLHQNL